MITHSGYVGIVGRPNVGKSSLLNRFVDQKISIVTRKPQTTRHQIAGITNIGNTQAVFLDTPGYQNNAKLALYKLMNKYVTQAVVDADCVLLVVEAMHWTEGDEAVFSILRQLDPKKLFLVINKVDKLGDKAQLLPYLQDLSEKLPVTEILPVSARSSAGLGELILAVGHALPAGPALFPNDTVSDRSEQFFAAEFLREKLMARLGDEIPYRLTITIDDFSSRNNIYHIHACIWVEKNGQKGIVIGKNGNVLKVAGKAARQEMELLFDRKVNLKTWVKVKNKWTDSNQSLKLFGFHE